jgi:hypothetical protein
MSTQEIFVQQFARLFHHYCEALSPEAEQESASLNSDHNRLVAAARSAILELETKALLQDDGRRYFAKPGEQVGTEAMSGLFFIVCSISLLFFVA